MHKRVWGGRMTRERERDENRCAQPQASFKLSPLSFQISPCFLLHIPRVTNWSFLNKVLDFCKSPQKKRRNGSDFFCAPKQCKQPLAFFSGGCMVECYIFIPLLQRPGTFFPFILYNSTRTAHFAKNYPAYQIERKWPWWHGERKWHRCVFLTPKMLKPLNIPRKNAQSAQPLLPSKGTPPPDELGRKELFNCCCASPPLVSLAVCQNRATPHWAWLAPHHRMPFSAVLIRATQHSCKNRSEKNGKWKLRSVC